MAFVMRTRFRLGAAVLPAVFVVTCEISCVAPTGSTVATTAGIALPDVIVQPPTAVLASSDTQQLRVTTEGLVRPLSAVRWESSDTAVATVSPSGVVQGIRPGRATVSALLADTTVSASISVVASPTSWVPVPGAPAPVTSVPLAPPTASRLLFWWDVESLHTMLGFDVQWFGGTSRTTTVVHGGSYAMQLDVIGDDGSNQSKGADLLTWSRFTIPLVGGPTVYYRWWMRIDPAFRWGNGAAKAKFSRTHVVATGDGYTGYVGRDGFWLGEAGRAVGVSRGGVGGGVVATCSPPNCDPVAKVSYDMRSMVDGAWHEYVVAVKGNSLPTSMDAVFSVYIDGRLVGAVEGFRLTDAVGTLVEEWSGWGIRPYFQMEGTAADGGRIYLDDFATYTAWDCCVWLPPATP